MMNTHSFVQTDHASKYMKQLCKHFSHKMDVSFDDEKALCSFSVGNVKMNAQKEGLLINCESETAESMERMQGALDRHLRQFAWREEIDIVWKAS